MSISSLANWPYITGTLLRIRASGGFVLGIVARLRVRSGVTHLSRCEGCEEV